VCRVSTIRDIPTEVVLSKENGVPRASAVNCDHILTVSKGRIGALVAVLTPAKMAEVGRAVSFALDL
jgi:mRNA interferase MazF